jgi:hypothetical protein
MMNDPMLARLRASKAEYEKTQEALLADNAAAAVREAKEAHEAGRKWALEVASYEGIKELLGVPLPGEIH